MDNSALPALLFPGVVVLVVRAVFARRTSAEGSRARGVALTAAVAAAVPLSLRWLGLTAGFPVASHEDGWHWLVWIVPGAAVAGLVEAHFVRRPLARAAVQAAGALGACLLLYGPLPPSRWGVWEARGWPLWTLPIAGLWAGGALPVDDRRRRAFAVTATIAAVAAGPILFRGAHTFWIGAVAAVLASALVGACVAGRRVVAPLPRALGGVVATGLGGTLVAAHAYQGPDQFPASCALWLFAAAGVGACVPVRWGRGTIWAAAGLSLALAAVSAWTSGALDPYEVWW